MRRHSLFDVKTGLFVGRIFATNIGADHEHAAALAANTPAGMGAVEGMHDHLSRRIDIHTGEIVDYQPPPPSAEHEWNKETKRWALTAIVRDAMQVKRDAAARISELEAGQASHIRRLALNPNDTVARKALQDIETEITVLQAV